MNKKKIISYAIDAILVLIIVFLGYVQISMLVSKNDKKNYGVPRVFGKSFLYVATESMNNPEDPNCLKAGTGVIIEKVKDFMYDLKPLDDMADINCADTVLCYQKFEIVGVVVFNIRNQKENKTVVL